MLSARKDRSFYCGLYFFNKVIVLKVKYVGTDCTDLTNGNMYECLGVEFDCYRVIDESEEDYLYPVDEFVVVEE